MKRIFISFLSISTLLALPGSSGSETPYKSAVIRRQVNVQYLGPFDSIRKVDFRNLTYLVKFDKDYSFQIRDGAFNSRTEYFLDDISLDHVYYFRNNSGNPERALVQLTWVSVSGSSGRDGILLVFQIDMGSLVQIQQMDYDLQAEGTGSEFDPVSGVLTIQARSNDDSAHCCPKSIDIVTLRWHDNGFKEESHRRVPLQG